MKKKVQKLLSALLALMILVQIVQMSVYAIDFTGKEVLKDDVTDKIKTLSDNKMPNIVCEITEKRDEYSKEYLLEDGSICSIISSNPIHKLINGKWQNNNLDLEKEDSVYESINKINRDFFPQRSIESVDNDGNVIVNWADCTLLPSGLHKLGPDASFLVKINNTGRYLSNNKLVKYAALAVNCTVGNLPADTMIYEEDESWTASVLPSDYDDDKVLMSHETINTSGTCYWNVTDLFNRWDSGRTINNGLYFYEDNGVDLYVSNPCFVIRYIEVDNNSLDFTNHSFNMNDAGELYVNDITNNLIVEQKLISISYGDSEITLKRVYNSTDSSFLNYAGIGFRFNYESKLAFSQYYLDWEMFNGIKTRFLPSNPLVTNGDYQLWVLENDDISESNIQLWIKTTEVNGYVNSLSVNYNNMFILIDDLKYTFNSAGYATGIIDSNNNSVLLIEYSNGRISSIGNSDGNKLLFTYSLCQDLGAYYIQSIVAKNSDNSTICVNNNEELKVLFNTSYLNNQIINTVTFSNGDVISYYYDINGHLVSASDERGKIHSLSYVEYCDNTFGNQISGYSIIDSISNNITYNMSISATNSYNRVFSFSDGKTEELYYNNDYKLVTYKDTDNEYKCLNYDDEGILDSYVFRYDGTGLLQNGNFNGAKSLAPWMKTGNEISRSSSYYIDGHSARIGKDDSESTNNIAQIVCDTSNNVIVIEADKTYAFGGWAMTEEIIPDISKCIGISLEVAPYDSSKTQKTDYSDSDFTEFTNLVFDNTSFYMWQFRMSAFKLEQDSVVRIKAYYDNQQGFVFFDNITFFESDESQTSLIGVMTSSPVDYTYENGLITSETLNWDRQNESDLFMSTSYDYNSQNYLQEYNDYNGKTVYYQYEPLDNISTETVIKRGYLLDNQGNIVDENVLRYDADNLLVSTTQTINDVINNNSININTSYSYEFGQVTAVQHNGYSQKYEYDSDGLLVNTYSENINLPNNKSNYNISFDYDANELSQIDYSNGYRVVYVTGLDNQGNTQKLINCYSVEGQTPTLIKSFTYCFDSEDQVVSFSDNVTGITVNYISNNSYSISINNNAVYSRSASNDEITEEYSQEYYSYPNSTDVDTVITSYSTGSNYDGLETSSSEIEIEKNIYYYLGLDPDTHEEIHDYDLDIIVERNSIKDFFGRINEKNISMAYDRGDSTGTVYINSSYEYQNISEFRTSGLVSKYTNTISHSNSNTMSEYSRNYEYDEKGNISFVYIEYNNNIIPSRFYEYDNANQLITEVNFEKSSVAKYTYNAGGNLTAKIYYDYSDLVFNVPNREIIAIGEEIDRITYQYDSLWKDRMINYNGTTINYDTMGNPLYYKGESYTEITNVTFLGHTSHSENTVETEGTLEWNGNLLSAFETSNKRYEYQYDENGFRTQKEVFSKANVNGNVVLTRDYKLNYIWDNGVLVTILMSSYDENTNTYKSPRNINMIYDETGSPAGWITYEGVPYLFRKDAEENITGIIYTDGSSLCNISYDSWGNITFNYPQSDIFQVATMIITMAFLPASFHGYLYDYETGLLFNKGRCYSASWGRYLNPDSPENLLISSENPLDANPYLFCNNNIINYLDKTASWSRNYVGLEWKTGGFDVKMNDMFASRPICDVFAKQIIKNYGVWTLKDGYSYMGMNALRIASDLFAHYVGKYAKSAINKVNVCWGDGWILKNSKSTYISVRKNDPNAKKYMNIWFAAPAIKAYMQKDGILITL